MAFAIKVNANETNWDYNPYAFQYDMSVYVDLSTVDDEIVSDKSEYQIAAFCNEECRGIAETKTDGQYSYTYLRVRSNQQEGETISFKVKNLVNGKVAKVTETINFASQQTIGFPSDPFLITARNKYDVTFIIDGVEKTSQMYYGDAITAPEDPTKTGHTFTGWNPAVDITVPSHDVTYIAQFTVNTYKLTYFVDEEVYKEYDLDYGTAIIPEEAPTKDDFNFSGWSEIPETMPDHDVNVYGTFETTTSIVNIKADTMDSRIYNISGKILRKPQKGINIINGKKVLIK